MSSLQDQLLKGLKERYPSIEVKKINKDNFLDIYIPETNTKRGSHLFFNTSKGEIKIGFYSRDQDFVSEIINRNPDFEQYAQGFRILKNPSFQNVTDALNNAKGFIDKIINFSSMGLDDKITLNNDDNYNILNDLKSFNPKAIVAVKVFFKNGVIEKGSGSGEYEGCGFTLNYTTNWSEGHLEANEDENIFLEDIIKIIKDKPLSMLSHVDLDLYLGNLNDGYAIFETIWENEPENLPEDQDLYEIMDLDDSEYEWECPSSIEFQIYEINVHGEKEMKKIIWEGNKIKPEETYENKYSQCHLAALEGNVNELRRLIDQGVDPDIIGFDGKTPLHLAIINGHIDCVNLLIKSNVDIDRCVVDEDDPFGTIEGHCSPLKYAIVNMKWSIADILINARAKFDDIIENTASGATIFEIMNWTLSENENFDQNKLNEIENLSKK